MPNSNKNEKNNAPDYFGLMLFFIVVFFVSFIFATRPDFVLNNYNLSGFGKDGIDRILAETVDQAKLAAQMMMDTFEGLSVHTIFVIMHIVGLVLGFGSALFLDVFLIRHLFHVPIEKHTAEIAQFGAKLVSTGLMILWFSGAGFLVVYFFETPEKLFNPKIWAKVPIVIILTLNGLIIHAYTLKVLKRKIGQTLLEDERSHVKNVLLFTGIVSAISWGGATLLGATREFNHVFSSGIILGCYILTIIACFFVLTILRKFVDSLPRRQPYNSFLPVSDLGRDRL